MQLLLNQPARPAHAANRTGRKCGKCNSDKVLLTDAGGVLIRVLEDSTDTDLLFTGKPVYCGKCGHVFLWQ